MLARILAVVLWAMVLVVGCLRPASPGENTREDVRWITLALAISSVTLMVYFVRRDRKGAPVRRTAGSKTPYR